MFENIGNPLYPPYPNPYNNVVYPYSPQINYWGNINDRMYYTHFGGHDQQTIFPSGYSPIEYHLAKNMDWYLKNDPLLTTLGNTGNLGMGFNMNQPMNGMMPSIFGGIGMGGLSGMNNLPDNGIASKIFKESMTKVETINCQISSVENALKQDGLTPEQKTKLEAYKSELETLKEEVEKIINNEAATYKEVQDIKTKVEAKLQEGQKLSQEIAKEVSATNSESKTDDSNPSNEAQNDNNGDTKTNATKHKEVVRAMNDVCALIDKSISGCGTNYDDNEYGLKNIMYNTDYVNENTIVELFEAWEAGYAKCGDYADDKDGFIESLMDDCEGDQKEEIASVIVNLLEKRADKYNLDVTAEVAAARTAMKSNLFGWRGDGDIQKTVNALYKKVKAESDKWIQNEDNKIVKAKADKKTEETKKRNEEILKNQEIETNAKNQFLGDMREIWKDNKLEISDRVKFENGKFKVRIECRYYFGSDFNGLVKALENAGYDPKKYLAKEDLSLAA